MSNPITDIVGIDRESAAILKSAGVRSAGRFLEAASTMKARKLLAQETGIDCKRLLCWANFADRMRIKGVNKDYAELLGATGVDTLRELRHRNAARLAEAMEDVNKTKKIGRLLPSEKRVAAWIEQAKKLPLKITY